MNMIDLNEALAVAEAEIERLTLENLLLQDVLNAQKIRMAEVRAAIADANDSYYGTLMRLYTSRAA